MKNLLLMVAAILFSSGVFAQATETKKTETKTEKKETKYCCPKCDHCSSKAETCPHHKIAMEASESKMMYCCGKCDWTIPPVKGECHHSTASLYKDGTLYCVFCTNKGGKCPNCGMELQKIEIKKKKSKAKG